MNKSTVGASILNIITESLYDKPIVVFREYVQNSADSLASVINESNKSSLCSCIWTHSENLYFLDNGKGIKQDEFLSKMESIAFSVKDKTTQMGYKGIGRLSGISFCNKLRFINIVDYNNSIFQEYVIDCKKYYDIQKSDKYNELSFSELMSQIGSLNDTITIQIDAILNDHKSMFSNRNTGFLVILEKLTPVLQLVISDKAFEDDLCWLLPVPFSKELLSSGENTDVLFSWLSSEPVFEDSSAIAAQSYNIFFNNKQLFRPLQQNMFRTYLCKSRLNKYAVCIQSFSNEKIEIDKKNPFSGIRIYIDNMLLCDENELIPMLQQYGFTSHGLYELIQTVRGVGIMIYIVDKVNISANARRTFIEMTDQDSLYFLELVSNLVQNIYATRYALSHYNSALKKEEIVEDHVEELRQKAQNQLEILASDEIKVQIKGKEKQQDFESLSSLEQKRIIKGKLSKDMNEFIKSYLIQTNNFSLDTYLEDFKTWFSAN